MKKQEFNLRRLKPAQIEQLVANPIKAARAADLVYVTDKKPGISRKKRGKTFTYILNNKLVKDEDQLERIKKLAIPPAWESVWICSLPHGHLQATGLDALKRKQYRYHQLWTQIRNQTKYFRLYEFGRALPQIRNRLRKDLAKPGLPKEKVLALVVKLMELTNIRIGNNAYEKLYGSFGLTTLKDRHVKINGNKIEFFFKGKKGISHRINIRSKRFARLVKQCRDIPGKDLFQYIDETGNHHAIDSGSVNNYIKEISGKDFTAKDFRTWAGSTLALLAFKELGDASTTKEVQKKIVLALNGVSELLGNTRTVCKKYYVHPSILKLYENNTLSGYLSKLESLKASKSLMAEEHLLTLILKKEAF